ncbi:MAG: PSD1 and planctomycete cytochrome C domain-containing protein [Bryobacteraceae bacterium]|nr:PSD1 and planctomycete cytochrome C domain-containing protein [Bryobacteraceae bacterium]
MRATALILLLFSGVCPAADGLDLFETKVRPLLAGQCYACHSKTKVAGLRVDSREDLLKGGDNGPALVPGDPDKSLLVQAIRHDKEMLKMPKGGKLKSEEIAAVVEWVKLGAPWPASQTTRKESDVFQITPEQRSFWAFRPLMKAPPPAVKNRALARNWIDQFIVARLEQEGLTPAKPADRRTLIRRVTYDLTGLPPKPEEVDAFVNTSAPDAYSKLIDKLLESDAYGERWGRHWMDVSRFAEDDTRGLAKMGRGHEPYEFAYLYRDWVIRAFNEDMPFDQFAKAHIAADQLEEKQRVKMLPALGFLGQGPWYYDLTEPPVARADERHERVDTVTRGFLGLTVGCARCHDHKYDPISMKDYYALAGVFHSSEYFEHALVPKKIEEAYRKEEKRVKDMEKALAAFSQGASEQLASVLSRKVVPYMMAVWRINGPEKMQAEQVALQDKLDLELLHRWLKTTAKAPSFYPYMTPWQEMIKRGGTKEEAAKLAAEFQSLVDEVVAERSEMKKKNERIIARGTPEEEVKSVKLPNGFESFFDKHQLELKSLPRDRMNLYTDLFLREMDDLPEFEYRRMKPGLFVFRDWGLERQLSAEWNSHIASMRADIDKLRKQLKQFPFVHGVADSKEPANLKIHLRGSPYNFGGEQPRRFLEILTEGEAKPFTKGSGRLELAEAIARHPITARVIANRVWKWHFGTGIVDTPSNFGFGGERPTHPELLEAMARFLVDNGMSLKKLHREILMSATYQLSGEMLEANAAKDGANRLYWRFNRQRLGAEAIRDALLSVSGTLDGKMFGPSQELNDSNRRRTVYGKVSRFRLDTYLALFDFPNPNLTAEKRHITNVPLQRLFFLNSGFVIKQAEAFVKLLAAERTDEAKIRKAYRILYQREPAAAEVAAGVEFLAAEKKRNEPGPPAQEMPSGGAAGMAAKPAKDPVDLSKAPESKKDGKQTPPVDPWTLYAKVLLSSNELLYVQ